MTQKITTTTTWTEQDIATANTFIERLVVSALIEGTATGKKTVGVNIRRGYPLHTIDVVVDILKTTYGRDAYRHYTWVKINL